VLGPLRGYGMRRNLFAAAVTAWLDMIGSEIPVQVSFHLY
jgi:hypothetical protein